MRNFKNNFKRNRFRSNGDKSERITDNITRDILKFSNNYDFRRRNFPKHNQNFSKLIEKYNDLAREALSKGDKISSENYYQHADHFIRVTNEKNKDSDLNQENSQDKKNDIAEKTTNESINS